MRDDWPLNTNLRLAWMPPAIDADYGGLLTVPVWSQEKPIGWADYLSLLADQLDWMYQRAGQPRSYLAGELRKIGEYLPNTSWHWSWSASRR